MKYLFSLLNMEDLVGFQNLRGLSLPFIFSLLMSAGLLQAQVPQGFSYQAVARDSAGICIQNSLISLRISIMDDSATSNPIFIEIFSDIPTNQQGLFNIEIGSGTTQGGSPQFQELDWNMNGQSRHLNVEMSPDNDLNFVQVGMSRLLSVPYAQAAGNGLRYDLVNGDEFLPWYGENGERNGVLGGRGTPANFGILRLYDANGMTKVDQYVSEDATTGNGYGVFILVGENGNRNFAFGTSGTNNYGAFSTYDPNGDVKVNIQSENGWGGAGRVITSGPNGNRNIDLSIQTSTTTVGQNRGGLRIYDENGTQKIYLGVDANGNGILTKGVSNFVMDHPHDPTKDIVYACIEGPEAAAYERGTAKLINGEAQITFSEHFEIVANHSTMTVVLTPRSPDSKGLAAFEYTATGFQVKELFQGEGSYDFDWEVKAVRKGWEDYEVIRDKMEDPGGEVEDE